jgi:FtsH-binding integral membrane protein
MYQISGGTLAAACFCSALIGTVAAPYGAIMASIPWFMGVIMFGGTVCHFIRLKIREHYKT